MEKVTSNLTIVVIMVYLACHEVEYLKRKIEKGRLFVARRQSNKKGREPLKERTSTDLPFHDNQANHNDRNSHTTTKIFPYYVYIYILY